MPPPPCKTPQRLSRHQRECAAFHLRSPEAPASAWGTPPSPRIKTNPVESPTIAQPRSTSYSGVNPQDRPKARWARSVQQPPAGKTPPSLFGRTGASRPNHKQAAPSHRKEDQNGRMQQVLFTLKHLVGAPPTINRPVRVPNRHTVVLPGVRSFVGAEAFTQSLPGPRGKPRRNRRQRCRRRSEMAARVVK